MKNTNWKMVLIVLAIVASIVLLCVFSVQGAQNKAFGMEESVSTARANINVQEKRRVDLVYNLADCVMQYDEHEAQTLKDIVAGRGSTGDIENASTAIAAVAEAYPDMKSNENYKQFMTELTVTENLIAEYRSNYNSMVREYNRYVRKFHTRMFLDMLGYEMQSYSYTYYNAPVDAPQNLFGE